MTAPHLFRLLVLISRVAIGTSSLVANDEPLGLTTPQGFTYSINRPNESAPALNTSGDNMSYRCETIYGQYPDIGDCQDAFSNLQAGSEQRTFGQRHTGLPDSVIPLPLLVFGKKALCYIQLANVGDGPTAHGSLHQIRGAANAIIIGCVADAVGCGGIATNIGGDNSLGVIVGSYQPNVECLGAHTADPQSCLDILADMTATTDTKIFGPQGHPGVQEDLPQFIESSDGQCILKIFSAGEPDSTSWYDIWQAAEATFSVCNKNGRVGWYRSLGDEGNIFFLLIPPASELPNNGSQAVKLFNATSSNFTEAF